MCSHKMRTQATTPKPAIPANARDHRHDTLRHLDSSLPQLHEDAQGGSENRGTKEAILRENDKVASVLSVCHDYDRALHQGE
jgi:hypothetical protein